MFKRQMLSAAFIPIVQINTVIVVRRRRRPNKIIHRDQFFHFCINIFERTKEEKSFRYTDCPALQFWKKQADFEPVPKMSQQICHDKTATNTTYPCLRIISAQCSHNLWGLMNQFLTIPSCYVVQNWQA